jgi:hypothetical protein
MRNSRRDMQRKSVRPFHQVLYVVAWMFERPYAIRGRSHRSSIKPPGLLPGDCTNGAQKISPSRPLLKTRFPLPLQVFERPYRDLWPVELKQRWLEENLPVFCPVAAYQVAVRRGDNLLTDAFNQIASADPGDLRQGINVTFQEEEGYGPGVTREFFTLVRFAPESDFSWSLYGVSLGPCLIVSWLCRF